MRKVIIGNATLYLGDCLEVVPSVEADAVITDPPYPDEHTALYKYNADTLGQLGINKGLVFWSAIEPFPLTHSAVHIWDKKTGNVSEYERIFEIGGKTHCKVFRHYLINSTVAAQFTRDEYTGHRSQKPIALMRELVQRFQGVIVDPFMGSGTTGVACMELQRPFIGIEIHEPFFDIACERIENAQRQERLFA